MVWIIFVLSLAFIAEIRGHYPECDGNKPWDIEELRKYNQTLSYVEGTVNAHLQRINEWQGKAYDKLIYLDVEVARIYIESTFTIQWEKIKDVSNKQAANCYNVTSRDTKRTLEELLAKKRAECNVLYQQYPKALHIKAEWHKRNKEGYKNEKVEAKEAAIETYIDICKVSGHVTPALDEILKSLDYIDDAFISPAQECYNLIKDLPGTEQESINSVREMLNETGN